MEDRFFQGGMMEGDRGKDVKAMKKDMIIINLDERI